MMSGKKHRVMHVTLTLDIGGLETVIKELCRRLDPDRFSSEVLCLRSYDRSNIQELTSSRVPVHIERKHFKLDLGYFFRIARFIRSRDIDILHAHSGCFFYAALFARLSGVRRFIYTAHGLPILNRLQDRIEDNLASLVCTAVVPVSEEIKKVLENRMPMVKNKIFPILNGIDTDRFRPFGDPVERRKMLSKYNLPKDAFLVGSVGRLDPVKNYSMLLRAFSKMSGTDSRKTYLVLVGEGPVQSELKELATALKISQQVIFLGRQYRVFEILPLLDVFVLSSITEGTSIALLEAQACGVPAVVTDVGGNSRIIQTGKNGFLCALNDDNAMSEYLERLKNDQDLRTRMAQAAQNIVRQRFGLQTMVHQYETLFLQKSV